MESLIIKAFKYYLLLAISLTLFGCNKEQNTLAKIQVVDEQNQVVENAEVKLYPNPDPILSPMIDAIELFTNENGYAIFDLTDEFNEGTAGFRVLDITVTKDNLSGSGRIKIVEKEENFERITVSLP